MIDPTRFDLDERQRAMLAEMGVRVWWPQRAEAAVDAPPAPLAPPLAMPAMHAMQAAATVATPIPRPATLPESRPELRPVSQPAMPPATPAMPGASSAGDGRVVTPLPEALPTMGWADLQAAVAQCQSCALGWSRKAPVAGSAMGSGMVSGVVSGAVSGVGVSSGDAQAGTPWMVVGDVPTEEDEQAGQPFCGPQGQLLDNMLLAVGVRRQGPVPDGASAKDLSLAYLTYAAKCRTPQGRNPEVAELAVCSAYLARQVALAKPRVILAMGRFAIQTLLGSTEPLGKLRGRVHSYQGVPVVVTYPPSNLLRNPGDKAKAWADLVLALQVVQGDKAA